MMDSLSANDALALLKQCPLPLLIRDSEGRITAYNAAFENLVGSAIASDLPNLPLQALQDHPVIALLQDDGLVKWTDADQGERHLHTHDIILGPDKPARARLYIDISAQLGFEQECTRLNDELRQTTLTDSVTGLLNERGILLALEPQVARSRRYNSAIAIIVLHFDCRTGRDQLVKAISQLLKDQLRWADLIGCNEKHDFILALPETSAQAAVQLAEKLKTQIQSMAIELDNDNPVLSSFGVTDWRKNDNAGILLRRAELALGQACLQTADTTIAI